MILPHYDVSYCKSSSLTNSVDWVSIMDAAVFTSTSEIASCNAKTSISSCIISDLCKTFSHTKGGPMRGHV